MGGKDVAILQKVSRINMQLQSSFLTVSSQLCDSFEIGLFAELNEMIESKVEQLHLVTSGF